MYTASLSTSDHCCCPLWSPCHDFVDMLRDTSKVTLTQQVLADRKRFMSTAELALRFNPVTYRSTHNVCALSNQTISEIWNCRFRSLLCSFSWFPFSTCSAGCSDMDVKRKENEVVWFSYHEFYHQIRERNSKCFFASSQLMSSHWVINHVVHYQTQGWFLSTGASAHDVSSKKHFQFNLNNFDLSCQFKTRRFTTFFFSLMQPVPAVI